VGFMVDADTAYRIGLVNRLLDPEQLLGETLEYADQLSQRAPLAQELAKNVMHRIHGMNTEEALRLESSSFHDLAFSDDLKEGTRAFKEKRQADFKRR